MDIAGLPHQLPLYDAACRKGLHMKYWPIIRHVRYFILLYRVNRHYEMWMEIGYLPVNADSDYRHLDAIWRGEA